jgi:hypothetical protein
MSGQPQVTAYFADLDPEDAPIFIAIGRAVWGIAAFEKALLVEILDRRAKREGLTPTLMRSLVWLETHGTGDALLRNLAPLGITDRQRDQIRDLVDRRNALVHHIMEDPIVVRGVAGGPAERRAAVRHIEQLALDCGVLAMELHLASPHRLDELLGDARDAVMQELYATDPRTNPDPLMRKQLESIQAMGPIDIDVLMAELIEPATLPTMVDEAWIDLLVEAPNDGALDSLCGVLQREIPELQLRVGHGPEFLASAPAPQRRLVTASAAIPGIAAPETRQRLVETLTALDIRHDAAARTDTLDLIAIFP